MRHLNLKRFGYTSSQKRFTIAMVSMLVSAGVVYAANRVPFVKNLIVDADYYTLY